MIQHCIFCCLTYPQSRFIVHALCAKEIADSILFIFLCSNICNKTRSPFQGLYYLSFKNILSFSYEEGDFV